MNDKINQSTILDSKKNKATVIGVKQDFADEILDKLSVRFPSLFKFFQEGENYDLDYVLKTVLVVWIKI